jgi:deazaflavin-dependent oxidoreductase (nitroreductase family)
MLGAVRRIWFAVLAHSLNLLTLRFARAGVGPFTIVRHRGRRSGKVFETPIIVAPLGGDFVVELTYGDRVQWYRNVVAAGGCELVRGGRTTRIVAVEPLDADVGRAAYPPPQRAVLRLLDRHEFRRFVSA